MDKDMGRILVLRDYAERFGRNNFVPSGDNEFFHRGHPTDCEWEY